MRGVIHCDEGSGSLVQQIFSLGFRFRKDIKESFPPANKIRPKVLCSYQEEM